MENENWLLLLSKQEEIQTLLKLNQNTEEFGLIFSEEEVHQLVQMCRDKTREEQRIEFGMGILPKLIFTFCDSPYICSDNYFETILRLHEIFYFYKNESLDQLTDSELLEYMKAAFDGECNGSLEYLEGTILEKFARDIRREGRSFF